MATVTIEQLSGDDLVSLSAWLKEREEYNRVYGIGESNATKPPADVSYDRKMVDEYYQFAEGFDTALLQVLAEIPTELLSDRPALASACEQARAMRKKWDDAKLPF